MGDKEEGKKEKGRIEKGRRRGEMRREEVGIEDKCGMRKDRGKKDEKGERIREVGKGKIKGKREGRKGIRTKGGKYG